MLTFDLVPVDAVEILKLSGRIDGITAPQLTKKIEELSLSGVRMLPLHFENVAYISSAGLRVLLAAQKDLKKIGGELQFIAVPKQLKDIFRISGFDRLFTFFEDIPGYCAHLNSAALPSNIRVLKNDGTVFRCEEKNVEPGTLSVIGSTDPLPLSRYTNAECIPVSPKLFTFGTGLATSGEEYEDYKSLFGESVLLNGNFFVYPATKNSAVDYVFANEIDPSLTFKYFHGFGFSGAYSHCIGFENTGSGASLDAIVSVVSALPKTDAFGFVLLAESAGIRGMALRQVPILENAPRSESIFDRKNFADWIDFPIEPTHSHHLIAAAGIAINNREALPERVKKIFSSEGTHHIHAALFERGMLSKSTADFETELNRVMQEIRVLKVIHLMGASRFKSGLIGLIPLSLSEA